MTQTSPHPAELSAAREGALLLAPPLVDLEPLRVRGRDRVRWLNGMVTSDVAKLPVGAAQFSLHVGKTGKIVAELWIVHLESELVVAVPRGRAEELQAALDRYLIMEDCEILAGQPDARFILAVGPASGRIVEMARAAGLDAGGAERAGLPVGVVFGEATAVDAFVARSAAGASSQAPGELVTVATEQGWHHARVELGIGQHGVDFDGSAYPQEAALEVDAVSFSKGCYLGQEAVFMMQERGHPPRKLVRLEVERGADADGVAVGAVVKAGDVDVGTVTSATAGGDAALATVKWKHARAGTALTVGGRAATVA